MIENFFQIIQTINHNCTKTLEEYIPKLKEKVEKLAFLKKIERTVFLTSDLTLLCNLILQVALEILKARSGMVILLDPDSSQWVINSLIGGESKEVKSEKGESEEVRIKKVIPTKNTISGWAIKKKESVLVHDIKTDIRFQDLERLTYENGSFVYVPLMIKHEVIGLLWFGNKIANELFSINELISLNILANEAAISIKHIQLYQELERSYLSIIQGLALAIDARDSHTHGHSAQVARLAKLIAIKLNLDPMEIDKIYNASLLHDLGKVGISDEILKRKGSLNLEEDHLIKMHPVVGKQILFPIKSLRPLIPYVYHHHEWYDGSGYPEGLSGEKIPLGARIIAVADSFAAMASRRPRYFHGKSLSSEEALLELKKGKEIQYDPKIVEVFEEVLYEEKLLTADS
ncbi:HD domain-containing protein [bacterium]|nr:HD domain-containing protein [bacterium]MBU1152658.1 HD domain-containing protein [bacterium]MBU2600418.1 HD domain-containing protein [bacterium]